MSKAARSKELGRERARAAQEDRLRRVLCYLDSTDRPVRRRDIAEGTGINAQTLYLLLRDAVEKGTIACMISSARSLVGFKTWYAKTPEILEAWSDTLCTLRPPLDPVQAHKKKPRTNKPPKTPQTNWFNALAT